MKRSIYRIIRRHWEEVLRIKTEPEAIAFGFAVGTFLAVLPLLGLSVLIGFGIVLIWKKISKISLFGALAVWNPLTLIPIYMASLAIGNLLFGAMPVVEYELTFLENAYHFTRRFLVGNLIMATLLTIGSYAVVLKLARRLQNT